MQSTNPVFTRAPQFNAQQPAPYAQGQQYPGQPYAGPQQYPGQPYAGPQGGFPGYPQPQVQQPAKVMTLDDVITKTAITMGVLFLTAAATFMMIPIALVMPVALVSAIVGFIAVLMVSLRRTVNPAFVLAYAAIEGVFVGAFSKLFEYSWAGIVPAAVLGTFVAAGATLAAYRFLRIKITSQFRKIVTVSMWALLALLLVNLVFAFVGGGLGIRAIGPDAGPMAWLISAIAVVLAVASLLLDFDYIEQGIRNQLPASESWRGAFGLTVTMVWLYTELLRIMSYFRN